MRGLQDAERIRGRWCRQNAASPAQATAYSCGGRQEMAEHAEAPRPRPVRRAALPVAPDAIGRLTRDPASVGEAPQAVAHERRELAVHPAREREREALLGMVHDV